MVLMCRGVLELCGWLGDFYARPPKVRSPVYDDVWRDSLRCLVLGFWLCMKCGDRQRAFLRLCCMQVVLAVGFCVELLVSTTGSSRLVWEF